MTQNQYPPLPEPFQRLYGQEERMAWGNQMRAYVDADRAQRQEYPEAAQVCAEAYQVVGSLLDELGVFGTPEAEKILDNLSEHRLVHKDVLPWPRMANRAQRVPLTEAEIRERALKTIADIGQEIERAVLLPKKPPFIGSIQEGLPERQWLMSVKDLEEYVAQDRAQRVPLLQRKIFDLWDDARFADGSSVENFARAVERAHGIGAKP